MVKVFVRPFRQERQRLLEATLRFETGPGKQAQVDWSTTDVRIAGRWVRIQLFGMVLGYCRRIYVEAREDQTLKSLVDCHENAFDWFGGITETILYDNPKTICLKRDLEGKHITWNPQFEDFFRYYGFQARLCRPYRAQTKGKIESGVKFAKNSFFGLYGRDFTSLFDLNQKLLEWCLEIADERIHGTTHEKPKVRFQEEKLHSVSSKPRYRMEEDTTRIVPSDCLVVYKTNRYSVPWTYAGREVKVLEEKGRLKILHDGVLLAEHPLLEGKFSQNTIRSHFEGILRPKAALQNPRRRMAGVLWNKNHDDVEVRDLKTYEELCVEV